MECSFSPKLRSSIRPSTNSRSGLQLVRRYSRTVQSSSELGRVATRQLSRGYARWGGKFLQYQLFGACSVFGIVAFVALHRDAQGLEEMEVVLGERTAFAVGFAIGLGVLGGLGAHLIQADRRLQHQQYVEAVLADILDHPGDLLALDDRLVDGLAQLLNE